MAGIKFDKIYRDLQQRIDSGEFEFQDLLPSETEFCRHYGCSRNTVRRALNDLALQGYVQSMHGKGVRVIHQPARHSDYQLGRVESFKETMAREPGAVRTLVAHFNRIAVDPAVASLTSLPEGEQIYYIQRVRYFDEKAYIIDHNYFLCSAVPGLTPAIASDSIYEYIENVLGMRIVTTKRTMTVERTTELDERYLELDGANCVAVIGNSTFNADGVMFEFTQSRHSPERFVFHDRARRLRKKPIRVEHD